VQVISLNGHVLGTGELSVIDDTVIIDRLDVELVSGVQLSVEAKSDFPGAIAAQVTKTYRLHSYLQVLHIRFLTTEKQFVCTLSFLFIISFQFSHFYIFIVIHHFW